MVQRREVKIFRKAVLGQVAVMNGSATLEYQLLAQWRLANQLHCQSQMIIFLSNIQRILERLAVGELQLLLADHSSLQAVT